MSLDKLLRRSGPLERLFSGSPSAAILDFLILASQENQIYSVSEVAQFSGISLNKAKQAISDLQKLGLVTELIPTDNGGKSGTWRRKKYRLKADNKIMIPLEKLVLALTEIEVRKPSIPTEKTSDQVDQYIEEGIGDTASELVEKGLLKLDNQTKQG